MESGGKRGTGASSHTRATVVAANADGSRRVVVRSAMTYGNSPEEVTVGAFDVYADGRSKPVGRAQARVSVSAIFATLPLDGAAAAGGKWVGAADWTGTITGYSAAPGQTG